MELLVGERKLVTKILNNRISELNRFIYNSRKSISAPNQHRTEDTVRKYEIHISKMEYEIEQIEKIIEKLD